MSSTVLETDGPQSSQSPEYDVDAVPGTPVLAPDVELEGEMPDTAYARSRWLVRRGEQFVQVTELLFRTLEQIDGRHTVGQIADGVSDSIHRRASPNNVRQLLSTKLIPLGLVRGADGTVVTSDAIGARDSQRSPLQITLRVRALSPRVIDPCTAVLQALFWPPVLVCLVLLALGAQIHVAHGIISSVGTVLYHPALLLPVFGLTVLATVWHEFGHAAALRYGGGQVRGMGVGLYIVYPAFYTDVTDNYRLSRWSRVRTDLGGFYFNLIWCTGIVGVYLWTHVSWLLVLVLVLDLEILQQTLPFGRFDGYWVLADLTGLPDFYSRIPGFLRATVPFVSGEDTEFTEYRPWVRVVFAVYVLIAVPVMAIIFLLLIKSVPHVLGTAWQSAGRQLLAFHGASAHDDLAGMMAAAGQVLVLLLPAFGLLYMLVMLGRRAAARLWVYSRPSASRKFAAGLIAGALVAGVALLWTH